MGEDKALEHITEKELEQLWLDEAESRCRAIDAGKMELLPGDEVMKEARARCFLQQAVADAEGGIAAGEWIDHTEIAAKLKHWAGDESPE
jgi:predicted transcriptional regulator